MCALLCSAALEELGVFRWWVVVDIFYRSSPASSFLNISSEENWMLKLMGLKKPTNLCLLHLNKLNKNQ